MKNNPPFHEMTEIEQSCHSRTMEISNQTSSVLPQSPLIEQSDRRKRRRNRRRILIPFSGTALTLLLYILYHSSNEIGIVHGFPTGAGGCAGDGAAVGGSHLFTNKSIEEGDLTLGGIVVTIGGTELDTAVKDTDFPLNQDLEIVVDGTFVTYRGVLIRMQVPDSFTDDTSKVLVPSSPLLKSASACILPVVGLTHTNPSDKQSTSGTLNFPSEAVGVIFDVTIVFINSVNASAYLYSRFLANFRNSSSDAPTPSFFSRAPTPEGAIVNITSSPTTAGGTPRPTISPQPTLFPTLSFSPTTTPFPSPRPTLSQNVTDTPTTSALPTLTFPPTLSPENLESDQPSIVPTSIQKSPKGKGMMMGSKKKGKGMMKGKKGSKKKGGKGMGMGMSSKGKMGKGGKGMGKSKKDKDKKGKDKKDKDKGKAKDKAKSSNDDYYDDNYEDDNYGDDDGGQARTSNDDDYYDDDTGNYNDDAAYTTTDNYLVGPDEYKTQLNPLIKKLPAPVNKKPVKKPVRKPVPKPVKKPVPKPVQKPVAKPIKKPVPRPRMRKPVPKPASQPVKKTYYATSVLKPVTPPTKVTPAPTTSLLDKLKNNIFYRVNTVSRGQSRTRTINQRER